MLNKKMRIRVIFVTLVFAILVMNSSNVFAYKGLFSFSDDSSKSKKTNTPSPLYQGVIAPSDDPEQRRIDKKRAEERAKSNPNLETYAEFEAEKAKEREKKQRLLDQQERERQRQEDLKPKKTSPPPRYRTSNYVDTNMNMAPRVQGISEKAKKMLSNQDMKVDGMYMLEYAMKSQITGILKEVNSPSSSKREKAMKILKAKSRLYSLANGLRMRESISANSYQETNLPENIIRDEIEGGRKALEMLNREIQKLNKKTR